MNRRPRLKAKKITQNQVKSYKYVQPNPGVRAIAAINGRGSYSTKRKASNLTLRSKTSGLSAAGRRKAASSAVKKATRGSISRKASGTTRHSIKGKDSMYSRNARGLRRNRGAKAWRGTRKVSFRLPRSTPSQSKILPDSKSRRKTKRKISFRVPRGTKMPVTLLARNRRRPTRRKAAKRRMSAATRRKISLALRRNARKVARPVVRRRRAVTRRKAAPKMHHHMMRRNGKRKVVRRRKKSMQKNFLGMKLKRNGVMSYVKSGTLITSGFVSHKLLTNFVKNLLVSQTVSVKSDAPAAGVGLLPMSMAPYSGIISGTASAAAGVYLVSKVVKDQKSRQLISGGMVASLIHTCVVDLVARFAPSYAGAVSGVDATAARLSAMYGVGASIEPMYADIQGTGEYFSSGVGEYFSSGLGAIPSYEAAAGTGEYFSSGLGEYGNNPDMMQAAAGYGAVESTNSNHLDPSSNLDRELTIAEAAAGVGSVGPMQAAAGLGNISTVGASQTWIPGESDPQIWAGVRPVDRSQESTAMIPAGSLQSGGGQGIFG